MTPEHEQRLTEIDGFAQAIEAGPDEECICQKCGELYRCDSGADPSALCHQCAQKASATLPYLVARVRTLESERRWIPVKERLPGKDVLFVLVVYVYCDTRVTLGACNDRGEWEDVGGFPLNVTHWMPLPKAPADAGR